MSISCRLLARLLLLGLLAPVGHLAAAPVTIDQGGKTLDGIARQLRHRVLTKESLDSWRAHLNELKAPATECIASDTKQKQTLQGQLTSLGKPIKGESTEVRKKRLQLKTRISHLDKHLANCHLLDLRIKDLGTQIGQRRQALLARELLARGPDLFTLMVVNLKQPGIWWTATETFLSQQSGLHLLSLMQWLLLLGFTAMALVFGTWLRRRLCAWAGTCTWYDDYSSRFMHALVRTGALYAPRILASAVAALCLLLFSLTLPATPFITLLAYGVCGYFLTTAVIRLLFNPPAPALPLLGLQAEISRSLSRRLTVLALLVLLGYLLFFTLLSVSLPDSSFLLARGLFAFFWLLNLVWAAWVLIHAPRFGRYRWLFTLAILSLLVSLGAEWLGYRNLSVAIWRILLGTLLSLGLALLVSQLLLGLFDSIDEGRYHWSQRLRRALAAAPDSPVPGIVWLRLLSIITVWLGFATIVLWIWGISDTVLVQIRTYLIQGFEVGKLHIVPLQIVWAIVIVALLISSGGWLRSQLDHHWLQHTRIERGTREALVTITGYVITIIAILIGLGVAGLDFSNLAIVAGALSVGVGFGLQNIVNNFVSGLILLFERPIKTGDWIVVGNTEGYVRRIRIRSTRIQTFDRADVIVPNSELIASQVTNKMLNDARGRISVFVGVAYGSDTERVRDILVGIANEHPRAITNGSMPKPYVLFRSFGDSSLDFELRLFIYNIDDRLRVTSDINFAIDKAFREAGIEIPFPQRDLHVRDWPGGTATAVPPAEDGSHPGDPDV